ncbi:DUF2254 domain-containing protein [Arundinibacter roseus]|uniref:DUF2254 domain-containing protein n=1 Tax=Arundinibacter roseus TaxID=2070510 RepID=A0A4R4KH52_9BACT|nr:DUF2254 domain-containing protein [Arundinibacter roseus]TDB67400.1 DUF2254 domain-containing protein [Arundinibacter roseus]
MNLLWKKIVSSLWFVPTLMTLSSIFAAAGLLWVDDTITYSKLPFQGFLYGGDKEGARAVLSTIASSMVSLAGVTFSITLVALTLASSQFGPRLLRNFISDKGNQVVIGTFISTFSYSLLVLLMIGGTGKEEFIPKISVVFAFLLSIVSLGVLIYFIHHMASSIQAESVITSSFKALEEAIHNFMQKDRSVTASISRNDARSTVQAKKQWVIPVQATHTGFLQTINFEEISEWASENDLVVDIRVQVGDFVSIHELIAYLLSYKHLNPELTKKATSFFTIGSRRTPVQEIDFSIKQIVEVAVRALSPGINDPHTAMTCIGYLGAGLSLVAKKNFPPIVEMDRNEDIRLIKKSYTYHGVVGACFNQIQIYATSNIYVLEEMLLSIRKVMPLVKHEEFKAALIEKSESLIHDLRKNGKDQQAVVRANRIYDEIMQY